MNMARFSVALLALAVITFIGCTPYGLIYSDVTIPYCNSISEADASELVGRSDTRQLKIPYGMPGLSANWSSHAIGDSVAGMTNKKLSYCDVRRLSVLGGIWKQDEILVYGR